MTERREGEAGLDTRLSRLRAATEPICPPAGLPDRVMRAVRAPRRASLAEVILLSSRRALALSAVAAAAAVLLSVRMEQDLTSAAAYSAIAGDTDASFDLLSDELSLDGDLDP